jgi:hypothetical protein
LRVFNDHRDASRHPFFPSVRMADIRRARRALGPSAPEKHEYEPRDCGGVCMACGCGKGAHGAAAPEDTQ